MYGWFATRQNQARRTLISAFDQLLLDDVNRNRLAIMAGRIQAKGTAIVTRPSKSDPMANLINRRLPGIQFV
jgi:hypothetical protein